MRKLASMLAAAALAVGFAGEVSAQGKRQGQRQGGGMGMGGFGGNVYMFISTNKDLQTELKVTDDQKTKLTDVAKKLQEARTAGGGGGRGGFGPNATDEERKAAAEARAKQAAETKKAYDEVLTPDQVKRLSQINLQYLNVRAFSDADTQKALKLTDDQKDKIKTVTDTYTTDSRALMGGGGRGGAGGGGGGGGRGGAAGGMSEENRKKMTALQKDAEEKIVAVLTDDQKKSWKDMVGEKFDVSKLTFAPRAPRDN